MENGVGVLGGDNGGSFIIRSCRDVNNVETRKAFRTNMSEHIMVLSFQALEMDQTTIVGCYGWFHLVDAMWTNRSLF